ncbi:hypothetical protein LZ554_007014 [Drepanopeziza brunnea f. sp. 'monogermtubi']|nr:hypothetical protein LZ554_007014 [Drepanopeziza brunnea f. sp. 'monogermtubi']
MSAAIAMAPSPAPHDRPSYIDMTPSAPHRHADRSKSPPVHRVASATPNHADHRTGSGSPKTTPAAKSPPTTARNGLAPKITIKKEVPSSPDLSTSRHRPRKLDLSKKRVIQSAPLHQSFTGRHQAHPLTRHIQNPSSKLANTSHIHHVPATQTSNRLPPITDVFAAEGLGAHREVQTSRGAFFPNNAGSAANSSHSNSRPAFPSPGRSTQQPPPSARPREYRSAEDAQAELAGGRPELLPKLVHYGRHQQPPTPPSPLTGTAMRYSESARSGGPRRRARAEYEEGGSPPLGTGPSTSRRGPFGEGRDSPASQQRKKEEFIRLCDRAWDLFHS